ncbi:hypothetical protein Y032_0009g614 [Ancylostoma ceylanicum]|uniref:7TM GPCR serpentine receptor class x (Srx) domain-containing protein n=1 Tax=Ancylostoma ceylanicum TaxID=53326 RepID=A0A016VKG1_9BILA|nr:hypothetical protein Y032_0009g614 [Ancylostoma ceylanicum]
MCEDWYKIFDIYFVLSVIAVIYYAYILYLITSSTSLALRSPYFRIFVVTGIFDIIGVIALEYTREELIIGFGSVLH